MANKVKDKPKKSTLVVGDKNKFFAYLKMSRESGIASDVTLIVGNDRTRIAAHRLVLSASSAYFSNIFKGPITELVVDQMSDAVLNQVLTYCYSLEVEITETNAVELFIAAKNLQMAAFQQELLIEFNALLNVTNFTQLLAQADHAQCSELKQTITQFVMYNFLKIIDSPNFVNLSAQVWLDLLANDDFNILADEEFLTLLLNWLQHDAANRNELFPPILGRIRMSQISMEFLQNNLSSYCAAGEAKTLYNRVMEWHRLNATERRTLFADEVWTRPRHTADVLVMVSQEDLFLPIEFDKYCFTKKEWQPFMKYLRNREERFAVTHSSDSLFFVGGIDKRSFLNKVEQLNFETAMWWGLPLLSTPRAGAPTVYLDGKLYVAGGEQHVDKALDLFEALNMQTNKWEKLRPLSSARVSPSLAILNGEIYCVGGCLPNDDPCLRDVQRYSPSKGTWTECASMRHRRCGCGIMSDGGALFVVGGRSNVIERYDPIADEWSDVCTLPGSSEVVTCVRYQSKIYGFGNRVVVESADPERRTWTECTTIAPGFGILGVFSIPAALIEKFEEMYESDDSDDSDLY